jgi:hypothetical protein
MLSEGTEPSTTKTNGTAIRRVEPLSQMAKRWRRAMNDGATGPLQIAEEVVSLAATWDAQKKEVGGKRFGAWLKHIFGSNGRGLAYFARRARAVEVLGASIKRQLHHEVAVWVLNNAPPEQRENVVFALMKATQEGGGGALSLAQATRVVSEILGRNELHAPACARCAMLEAKIRELTAAN